MVQNHTHKQIIFLGQGFFGEKAKFNIRKPKLNINAIAKKIIIVK